MDVRDVLEVRLEVGEACGVAGVGDPKEEDVGARRMGHEERLAGMEPTGARATAGHAEFTVGKTH